MQAGRRHRGSWCATETLKQGMDFSGVAVEEGRYQKQELHPFLSPSTQRQGSFKENVGSGLRSKREGLGLVMAFLLAKSRGSECECECE